LLADNDFSEQLKILQRELGGATLQIEAFSELRGAFDTLTKNANSQSEQYIQSKASLALAIEKLNEWVNGNRSSDNQGNAEPSAPTNNRAINQAFFDLFEMSIFRSWKVPHCKPQRFQ